MKRTILLLFCLVMPLVLPACSGMGAEPRNEKIPAEDPAPAPVSADSGYRVGYALGDEFTGIFTDTPQEANAGDTVEIRTAICSTPTSTFMRTGRRSAKRITTAITGDIRSSCRNTTSR